MVQPLQGTFFRLAFILVVFRPSWVTPLTFRPLASVSGRCCKACACLFVSACARGRGRGCVYGDSIRVKRGLACGGSGES